MPASFAGYVNRKVLEIDRVYAAYLAKGFVTAAFEGQPEPETLQCRNEHDRTNWLGLLIKCLALRDAGLEAAPLDPPIRCTSNRMYPVTVANGIERMFVLLEQVAAAQASWWRLKDLARACERRDDLNLIDLTEGWP